MPPNDPQPGETWSDTESPDKWFGAPGPLCEVANEQDWPGCVYFRREGSACLMGHKRVYFLQRYKDLSGASNTGESEEVGTEP